MADLSKLVTMLNDPQTQDLLQGLRAAHGIQHTAEPGRPAPATGGTGESNAPPHGDLGRLTPSDVRAALGTDAIDDVAHYMHTSAGDAADRLAAVLPGLVQAARTGGGRIDSYHLNGVLSSGIRGGEASS